MITNSEIRNRRAILQRGLNYRVLKKVTAGHCGLHRLKRATMERYGLHRKDCIPEVIRGKQCLEYYLRQASQRVDNYISQLIRSHTGFKKPYIANENLLYNIKHLKSLIDINNHISVSREIPTSIIKYKVTRQGAIHSIKYTEERNHQRQLRIAKGYQDYPKTIKAMCAKASQNLYGHKSGYQLERDTGFDHGDIYRLLHPRSHQGRRGLYYEPLKVVLLLAVKHPVPSLVNSYKFGQRPSKRQQREYLDNVLTEYNINPWQIKADIANLTYYYHNKAELSRQTGISRGRIQRWSGNNKSNFYTLSGLKLYDLSKIEKVWQPMKQVLLENGYKLKYNLSNIKKYTKKVYKRNKIVNSQKKAKK